MAHDAVQDLLDKVWFGGTEPCQNKGLTMLCCMFPFLVPFLLSPSKDKLIDRPEFWNSGLCYGLNIDTPQKERVNKSDDFSLKRF